MVNMFGQEFDSPQVHLRRIVTDSPFLFLQNSSPTIFPIQHIKYSASYHICISSMVHTYFYHSSPHFCGKLWTYCGGTLYEAPI
jgi:hypothetical protein